MSARDRLYDAIVEVDHLGYVDGYVQGSPGNPANVRRDTAAARTSALVKAFAALDELTREVSA